MSFGETLAQAFKLFVTIVGYAIEQAKKREERIANWRERQVLFEKMVSQAMIEMRLRAELDRKQVDLVDDAVDKALEEIPPHGKTVDRVDDLQQRADDPGGTKPPSRDN